MVQIITNNGGGGGVGLYKYKGSVDYYEDLPTSGMKVGDTYNVVNAHTTAPIFPAGSNIAWTGTEWDVLGGNFDLDDYQKKLVEGEGIDIDQDTNEISVEDTVISGAEKGATALQPNDNVSELVNDAGYLVSSDLKQSDWGQADSSAIDYIKNKPTIGNATLKIQKNGTDVSSITMNATSDVTANISVPTDTSDLTNGAGFVTNQVNNTAYGSSWDGDTTNAPSKNAVYDEIETINEVIPSAATSSNQLADKNYVDNGINSVSAYYITKNAAGNQFATYTELSSATTFYSGGVVRVPTRNDYTIVLADETHDNEVTRYIYNNGWEYQYSINESPMTQAQLDAINSGITSAKVTTYDGYASAISGKQDVLSTQTAYTSKGTSTKVATITTNTLGQVTSISETSIAFPVTSVNGSTGAVTGLQTTANLKTSLSDNSDSYYPSQKAVKTAVDGKQAQHTTLSLTLSSSGWGSNTQTVTATGVTASNTVIVSPAPSSFSDYTSAVIYCTNQASNSLTFTCTTEPTSNITVNVAILN